MKKQGKLIDNPEKRKQLIEAKPEILKLVNKEFKVTMIKIFLCDCYFL